LEKMDINSVYNGVDDADGVDGARRLYPIGILVCGVYSVLVCGVVIFNICYEFSIF
jgi:hypothetical protein